MRQKQIMLWALLSLVSWVGFGQDAERIQGIFSDFCNARGYEDVTVDSDGDVRFKYDELQYYIGVNEEDLDYANLVLLNIWPIESQTEMINALQACNEVSRSIKVVKAYVQNDNVVLACEIFVEHPEDFRTHIPVALEYIGDAVKRFVEEME